MDLRKARKAARVTAKRHRISEKEAIRKMECAIAEARRRAFAENNTDAIAQWGQIPCKGDIPTAYELIAYLAEKVEMQSNA